MKRHAVVWRPNARADLLALYDWIAERADPDTAFDYTSRIEAHAEKLAEFPERGARATISCRECGQHLIGGERSLPIAWSAAKLKSCSLSTRVGTGTCGTRSSNDSVRLPPRIRS